MADREGPSSTTHSADTARSQGQSGDLARGDPDSVDEFNGRSGGGDSGGGAYPNPHSGKKPGKGGFMGSGGQSEMEYHGTGRLGEQETGDNANAPAGKSGPGEEDGLEK
ncbi:MAG TPA: hypothetical protein VF582_04635 [Allosphingosinicella sp.]|jgi:hypothetical protein